jgi:hypothetical protein
LISKLNGDARSNFFKELRKLHSWERDGCTASFKHTILRTTPCTKIIQGEQRAVTSSYLYMTSYALVCNIRVSQQEIAYRNWNRPVYRLHISPRIVEITQYRKRDYLINTCRGGGWVATVDSTLCANDCLRRAH